MSTLSHFKTIVQVSALGYLNEINNPTIMSASSDKLIQNINSTSAKVAIILDKNSKINTLYSYTQTALDLIRSTVYHLTEAALAPTILIEQSTENAGKDQGPAFQHKVIAKENLVLLLQMTNEQLFEGYVAPTEPLLIDQVTAGTYESNTVITINDDSVKFKEVGSSHARYGIF